jgi:hypothetical protein
MNIYWHHVTHVTEVHIALKSFRDFEQAPLNNSSPPQKKKKKKTQNKTKNEIKGKEGKNNFPCVKHGIEKQVRNSSNDINIIPADIMSA